jgi:single-strand DNA-binding protein
MAGDTTLTIVGNTCADPELRFTQSGAAVCSFTVASTPRVFDKQSGQYRDGDALFLRVNVWRQMAEQVAESVVRGTRVVVTGRLRQRSFDTKQGEKRTVIELEADEVAVSLRYATATVNKAERSQRINPSTGIRGDASGHAPADDPWGSAPPATGSGFADEPPFSPPVRRSRTHPTFP